MSRSSSRLAAALAAAALGLLAAPAGNAADRAPWQLAAEVRTALADAERALLLGRPAAARAHAGKATPSLDRLAATLGGGVPVQQRRLDAAIASGDMVEVVAARAALQTAILGGAYRRVLSRLRRGDVEEAGRWLLVREFRAPTRFSRPGADATLALSALAQSRAARAAALAAVRADYLDTYQARLSVALESAAEAYERGFPTRIAASAALARGYFAILEPAYARQRGAVAAERAASAFERLARAGVAGNRRDWTGALTRVGEVLEGFRAAPLAPEEEARRAGQFLRFLALVPIEYRRGVADGRVTLAFEVQEAITFNDGARQALADLESELAARDADAATQIEALVAALGNELAAASEGNRVAAEQAIETKAAAALELAERVFPDEWLDALASADFDVIRTSLDRVVGAARAGEYGTAEQARLEAYAFFEFGPEQRLRGLAPDLFVRTESLFWYGTGDVAGLAQLLRRKAAPEEVAATRQALDSALADSAGVASVAEGAVLGAIGVACVGVLTIALQRKLPHRRMLELTGLLILGVLVVMVGKTVQVCQVVGWLPVHPIGELRLPYWAGLWFGVFPTWEGAVAQLGAAGFVVASYFGAEWLRS